MEKNYSKRIYEIIAEMTLEEKASLCSGKDFWYLKGIERLGIPSIMVTDGPHGLRKQLGDSGNLELNASVPATCFPTAATLGSSWDRDLLFEIGTALGETCLQENVSVILGPGINIKRSPLCGRNFEYFSEDPYISGELAASMIRGIQSQGIGTSLKHFAGNNQESNRMTIDATIDERALREIYLTGFEIAVKKAKPWTVMCSYNKLNGTYVSEHKKLLTEILRDEWGYEGLVMTDWGANNDRVSGLIAGQDLEMPFSGGFTDKEIVMAVKSGVLKEEILNQSVQRNLKLILKGQEFLEFEYRYDLNAHHALARRAASESAVLLKNDENILPLVNKEKSVALIGQFAKIPRYQGAGSSLVVPTKLDTAFDAYKLKVNESIPYAAGYDLKSDQPDQTLIEEACMVAKSVDVAIVMVGLTDAYESEGFDRTHLNLPRSHDVLIESVLKVNPNTVVVLNNGSPVLMPWFKDVKAVLECYLPGQAGGIALWDLLLGDVNPSGKLAETFPIALEDAPVSKYYPMGPKGVEYRESIYVGYRYYDKSGQQVKFPFGFGLSYTNFEYDNLILSKESILDSEMIEVCVDITNSGQITGKEIVELYVRDVETTIFRPEKELKGFDKITLEPGEKKTVKFSLDYRSFAYYDVNLKNWMVESGEFELLIGSSSKDIHISKSIKVQSTHDESETYRKRNADKQQKTMKYYDLKPNWEVSLEEFEELLGRKIIRREVSSKGSYDRNSTVDEIRNTFIGRRIYKSINSQIDKMSSAAEDKQIAMIKSMVNELPLRNLAMMSGGKISTKKIDALIDLLNGKVVRGIIKLF